MRETLWRELKHGRYIVAIVVEPLNEGETVDRVEPWQIHSNNSY